MSLFPIIADPVQFSQAASSALRMMKELGAVARESIS